MSDKAKFRILGISDEHCECCHCGKSNLKSVIHLTTLDIDGNSIGDNFWVGSTCVLKYIVPDDMKHIINKPSLSKLSKFVPKAQTALNKGTSAKTICDWLYIRTGKNFNVTSNGQGVEGLYDGKRPSVVLMPKKESVK
jgi:hypothetical protein